MLKSINYRILKIFFFFLIINFVIHIDKVNAESCWCIPYYDYISKTSKEKCEWGVLTNYYNKGYIEYKNLTQAQCESKNTPSCPAGEYLSSSTFKCLPCPLNYYCPYDKYNGDIGVGAHKCPTGTYTTGLKSTKESDCIANSVTPPTSIKYCKSEDELIYNGLSQTLIKTTQVTGYILRGYFGTNAGTYTITATLKDGYVWNDKTVKPKTFTCKISKRKITVAATDQSKNYDGTVLRANNECKVINGSLVNGHTLTCVAEGSQINVGNSNKILKSVTIKDKNGNGVSNNYDITKQNGKLTVTSGCPKLVAYSGTYDGSNHSISVTPVSGATIIYSIDNKNWVTSKPTRLEHGTTTVYVRIKNSNSSINCGSADITIYKRTLKVKAKDQTKTYDGKALNADDTCEVISGSLLDGDKIICTNTGSQTNVGNSVKTLNTIKITNSKGTDISSYYEITKENGKLTVTSSSDSPSISETMCQNILSYTAIYNRNKHTLNIKNINEDLLRYRTSTKGSWSATKPTRTEIGTTIVYVQLVNGSKSIDCGSRKIIVSLIPIKVKALDQIKTYDGKTLYANSTCNLISGSLLDGDKIVCTNTGSQTNVGNSVKTLNTVTIIDPNGIDVSLHYNIIKSNGLLIVNKTGITCPSILDYKGTYDGSGHSITVGSIKTGTLQYRVSKSDSWSTSLPERTNVGETTVYVRVVDDKSSLNCNTKKILILKRKISVGASNQSKINDGTALKAKNTCDLINGSLVKGDNIKCTTTGFLTTIGTSVKKLNAVKIINSKGKDVTANYDITKKNGKLKIIESSTNNDIKSIKINVSKTTIKVGETIKINLTFNPTNSADKSVVYSSSDDKILFVDDEGNVKGISEGVASINVKTVNGNKTDSIKFNVEKDASIYFEKDTYNCQKGSTITSYIISSHSINSYTSSNESIATIIKDSNKKCAEFNVESDNCDVITISCVDKGNVVLSTENIKKAKSSSDLYITDIESYTLTYDSNGGTVCDPKEKNVLHGDEVGTLCTPSKTGYTFDGWYTLTDDGEKINNDTILTDNITVYAHWNIIVNKKSSLSPLKVTLVIILIIAFAAFLLYKSEGLKDINL